MKDGIEYSAPLNREGFIVATWVDSKSEIWSRQVYVIKHQVGLEKDVQTCFITEIQLEGEKLRVTDEQGDEFEVDLDSLTVKLLKGRSVIDYTKGTQ